jgi:hypothetical protein
MDAISILESLNKNRKGVELEAITAALSSAGEDGQIVVNLKLKADLSTNTVKIEYSASVPMQPLKFEDAWWGEYKDQGNLFGDDIIDADFEEGKDA